MNVDSSKRNWITISKGIGILLVVLGHMNIPYGLSVIIYSFHMPLFFLLSGIVFNQIKYNSLKVIIVKKSKTLIYPFFTFSFLYIALYALINSEAYFINDVLLPSTKQLLLLNESINTPLWFLTTLFSIECIFVIFLRSCLSNYNVIIRFIIIICGGIYLNSYFKNNIILNINIACLNIIFFYIGLRLKSNLDDYLTKSRRYLSITFICTLFVFLVSLSCSIKTGVILKVDILNGIYGNYLLYLLLGLSGSFLVIIIAASFDENFIGTFFKFLGNNSLIILGTHTIIPQVVRYYFSFPDLYRVDRLITIIAMLAIVSLIAKKMQFLVRLK